MRAAGSMTAMRTRFRASPAFWTLALLVGATFLFGGGARSDIASLMFLRPVAILALGFGLLRLHGDDLRGHRLVLGLALAAVLLVASHLAPLPPEMWHRLPGRDLVAAIDAGAGLGAPWRPLSLDPDATRNALFAALVPFAVLVLGVQLTAREKARLVPVLLAMGAASALLGLMQTLGERDGPLYFYAITSNGAPTGLFANRNHQALFLACLLPLLAVTAYAGSRDRIRELAARNICALAAILLVPLILVTGSRMGMIAAAIALLAVPLVLKGRLGLASGRGTRGRVALRQVAVPLVAIGLAGLTVWLDRAVAWNRLIGTEPDTELRLQLVPVLHAMIRTWFPAGSGIGTFQRVFQASEPDALLAAFYANHAHNDWLELALTAGAPGLVLAGLAAIAFAAGAIHLFHRAIEATPAVLLGRAGLVIVLLLGIGSWSDYPLRVPSLAVLFALAVVFASGAAPRHPSRESER